MSQISLLQGEVGYSLKWPIFKTTDLRKLYKSVPWDSLAMCPPPYNPDTYRPKRWFGNAGMFGVRFLKHYGPK